VLETEHIVVHCTAIYYQILSSVGVFRVVDQREMMSLFRTVFLVLSVHSVSSFVIHSPQTVFRTSASATSLRQPSVPSALSSLTAKSDVPVERRQFISFGSIAVLGFGFSAAPSWAAKGDAANMDFTGSSVSR
jgi:hypothetical protein